MKRLFIALATLISFTLNAQAGHDRHVAIEDAKYKCKRYMDKSRAAHWRAHFFRWDYDYYHDKRDHYEMLAEKACRRANADHGHTHGHREPEILEQVMDRKIKERPQRGYDGPPKQDYGYKDELRPIPKPQPDFDLDKEPRENPVPDDER